MGFWPFPEGTPSAIFVAMYLPWLAMAGLFVIRTRRHRTAFDSRFACFLFQVLNKVPRAGKWALDALGLHSYLIDSTI